jgi:nuclear pore complex protein Nup62
MFGQATQQQGGPLFGSNPPSTGLFGNTISTAPAPNNTQQTFFGTSSQPSNFFGNTSSSQTNQLGTTSQAPPVFGNTTSTSISAAPIFGTPSQSSGPNLLVTSTAVAASTASTLSQNIFGAQPQSNFLGTTSIAPTSTVPTLSQSLFGPQSQQPAFPTLGQISQGPVLAGRCVFLTLGNSR